jgi:hypothetical protein
LLPFVNITYVAFSLFSFENCHLSFFTYAKVKFLGAGHTSHPICLQPTLFEGSWIQMLFNNGEEKSSKALKKIIKAVKVAVAAHKASY